MQIAFLIGIETLCSWWKAPVPWSTPSCFFLYFSAAQNNAEAPLGTIISSPVIKGNNPTLLIHLDNFNDPLAAEAGWLSLGRDFFQPTDRLNGSSHPIGKGCQIVLESSFYFIYFF